jgi:hypothetical protein
MKMVGLSLGMTALVLGCDFPYITHEHESLRLTRVLPISTATHALHRDILKRLH